MKALMIALSMMSTGCATTRAEAERPADGCDAAPAQKLVGREATGALGAEALRLTGASAMRRLPEGSIVTMEFRADRLNIHLDRQNRVARINCG